VAVAPLIPAAAGPVDEAIAAVRVQIAEVEEAIVGVASTIVRVKEAIVGVEAAIVGAESAISGLEAAIVAEGGRIVAYHGDLEAVDVAIAEIEARIATQDEACWCTRYGWSCWPTSTSRSGHRGPVRSACEGNWPLTPTSATTSG